MMGGSRRQMTSLTASSQIIRPDHPRVRVECSVGAVVAAFTRRQASALSRPRSFRFSHPASALPCASIDLGLALPALQFNCFRPYRVGGVRRLRQPPPTRHCHPRVASPWWRSSSGRRDRRPPAVAPPSCSTSNPALWICRAITTSRCTLIAAAMSASKSCRGTAKAGASGSPPTRV